MSLLIIQKFGGTSVGSIPLIKAITQIAKLELDKGNQVVLVVSAMAGITNQLVTFCNDVSSLNTDKKYAEYDTALCSGEIVAAALTALSLQERGINSRSVLAWQLPIKTTANYSNATVQDIDIKLLKKCLQQNVVPVIAGFQGIDNDNRCTTLGRGGSDTTASLIAAVLKADRCDIYSDVDGVFTADPRIVPKAKKIHAISFEEMLELASSGAKVLHPRCVVVAAMYYVPIRVLSSFSGLCGTLITSQDKVMENSVVRAITSNKNLLKVDVKNTNLDKISRLILDDGIYIEMVLNLNNSCSLIIQLNDKNKLEALLQRLNLDFVINTQIATVSIVGYGIKNDITLIAGIINELQKADIPIIMIQNFEIKLSLLLEDRNTEKAIKVLHELIIESNTPSC